MIPACDASNPPPNVPAWFCQLAARDECVPPQWRYLWPELAALIRQESGFRAWALRDETEGRAVTEARSVAAAKAYIARNRTHKFGVGLTMITGTNLQRWFGDDWQVRAFNKCDSMFAGMMHFVTENMPRARAAYNGTGEAAQRHAMRVTGHLEQITGSFAAVRQPVRPTVTIANACGAAPPAWLSWQAAQHRACMNGGR